MRFLIGLLLGMILGIGATAFFLTTGKGGDYLIFSSPRALEMEARLKASESDRDSFRKRLAEADAALARIEARLGAVGSRGATTTGPATSAELQGDAKTNAENSVPAVAPTKPTAATDEAKAPEGAEIH